MLGNHQMHQQLYWGSRVIICAFCQRSLLYHAMFMCVCFSPSAPPPPNKRARNRPGRRRLWIPSIPVREPQSGLRLEPSRHCSRHPPPRRLPFATRTLAAQLALCLENLLGGTRETDQKKKKEKERKGTERRLFDESRHLLRRREKVKSKDVRRLYGASCVYL